MRPPARRRGAPPRHILTGPILTWYLRITDWTGRYNPMNQGDLAVKSCIPVLGTAIAALCCLAAAPASPSGSLPDSSCAAWREYEGVALSFVNAIVQDADGYLWLGTDTGLLRFDGIRFV